MEWKCNCCGNSEFSIEENATVKFDKNGRIISKADFDYSVSCDHCGNSREGVEPYISEIAEYK